MEVWAVISASVRRSQGSGRKPIVIEVGRRLSPLGTAIERGDAWASVTLYMHRVQLETGAKGWCALASDSVRGARGVVTGMGAGGARHLRVTSPLFESQDYGFER